MNRAEELYRPEARFTAPDLKSTGDQTVDEFRVSHPEGGKDAIRALAWAYTFDDE